MTTTMTETSNVDTKSPGLPTHITDLPVDSLYLILIHLHRDDDKGARAFAQTCTAFHDLYRTVSSGGQYALPVSFAPPTTGLNTNMSDLLVTQSKPAGDLTLEKGSAYGDSYIVFDRDVRRTSAAWRLRLDVFRGHRLDVGVALASAFRFGMVERASSWSFDLFGRACIAGRSRPFGRHFVQGDVLTVVYNARNETLAFVDDACGACMGTLPVDFDDKSDLKLHPFVYFPALKGERMTLLRGGGGVVDLHRVKDSVQRWCREPARLPYDGCVIVATWEEHRWYALHFDDVETTTLATLWAEIAARYGMAENVFELIFNGVRLPNTEGKTLGDVGIEIDRDTGSCTADILLSVPHIMS